MPKAEVAHALSSAQYDPESKRTELVGRIAEQVIRVKYVGQLIKKQHGHGSPFASVGFPDNTDKPTTSMLG